MLPLYDTIPVKSRVFINWMIPLVNLMMLAVLLNQPIPERSDTIYHLGMVPALIFNSPFNFLTLITCTFVHANFLHFLGNIFFLLIFGDNIEDLMGSARYLAFYILGGIAAAAAHLVTHIHSPLPLVGASGAIAAVMGAYLRYYPHSKITILSQVSKAFRIRVIKLPAYTYLGFWFGMQLFLCIRQILDTDQSSISNVAWMGHIGGFAFGFFMAKYFSRGKKPPDPKKQGLTNMDMYDFFEMFKGEK